MSLEVDVQAFFSLTGSEKKYWEFIKSQNYCNTDKKNLNDMLSQL